MLLLIWKYTGYRFRVLGVLEVLAFREDSRLFGTILFTHGIVGHFLVAVWLKARVSAWVISLTLSHYQHMPVVYIARLFAEVRRTTAAGGAACQLFPLLPL